MAQDAPRGLEGADDGIETGQLADDVHEADEEGELGLPGPQHGAQPRQGTPFHLWATPDRPAPGERACWASRWLEEYIQAYDAPVGG